MAAHPQLHRLAWALFGRLAKSSRVARCWLNLASAILRATPDFPLKPQVRNALLSYPWSPDLKFAARTVEVCEGCTIALHPHPGEFDFEALFTFQLNYERNVFSALKDRIAHYEAIVEIGANVGVYTLFFAKLRHSSAVPVFCFEPSPKARQRLEVNVGALHSNVHIIPAAVATEAGRLMLYEPAGHLTNGSLRKDFAELFSDDVSATLVRAVDGEYIGNLLQPYVRVLVKIDVEGTEAQVLEALREVVHNKKPDLVLEVLDTYVDALNESRDLLKGYDYFIVKSTGLVPMSEFRADPENRDYLLIAQH